MDVCVVDWGNIPEWLTLLVAGGGIAVAINQLRLNRKELKDNHEWNRRQLASTEVNKIVSEIVDTLKTFDEVVKYSERPINAPYSVDEIHEFFCEKIDNKFLSSKDGKSLSVCKNNRYIRTGIITVLNKYDYLAGGINTNVFDEAVVKKYCEGTILKAYTVFKPYIQHLREYYRRDSIYVDLESIAKKWEKNSPTTELSKTGD